MVAIRGTSTRKAPFWLAFLPQIIALFLCSTLSFYFGVALGMQMGGCSIAAESNRGSLRGDNTDLSRDFDARVEAEVQHRLAGMKTEPRVSQPDSTDQSRGGKGGKGRPRRFPESMSKFANGASMVKKNDFLSTFDYGIPKPPSKREHESDPGKDHVLLLYGSDKALPDAHVNTSVVYLDGSGNDTSLREYSAADATANCGGLNVIYTDTHGGLEQCIAIVGNYESYHIQRWLRINPRGGSKLNAELPLEPVGRGLQTNGQDKFQAPGDRFALENQALLETYLERLGDTLATLEPMAKECAGNDNSVMVMVCNTGQSDLLINFICSAEARGFGDVVKKKLIVFATDNGVYEIARGLGMHAFYDEKIFEKMPEKEARIYGDRSFTQMMYAKVVTVQLINRLGHDVLFQDVDVVWYQDPFKFFHDKTNPLYKFDMLFQDDGARSLRYAPYSANTGFYYVRANDKTKFLFRSLLYLGDMVLSMTSHQQALAALLDEHSSLTGLRVKTLGGADFPGGYHFHRKKEIDFMKDVATGKHVPYLLHMSWTTNKSNKLLFFKQMGLWYTNKRCEAGMGVSEADKVTEGGLAKACCSKDPIITCHYADKPSSEQCKNSDAPNIDNKGKPFWK